MGNEVQTGELKGWEQMLYVVTNNCGLVAVMDGAGLVMIGPTEDMFAVTKWLGEYLLEDD